MDRLIVVRATFDPEARVWTTESPDLHGLRLEDESLERLLDRIPGAVQDLLEGCDGEGDQTFEVPVEIIASAHARVRCLSAA